MIKRLHALECELVSEEGTHRITLRIDRIDHEVIDELRKFLGKGFLSLVVVPEGMAFMQVEIQFTE